MEGLKHQVEDLWHLVRRLLSLSARFLHCRWRGLKEKSICLETWRCWLWSALHYFSHFHGIVITCFSKRLTVVASSVEEGNSEWNCYLQVYFIFLIVFIFSLLSWGNNIHTIKLFASLASSVYSCPNNFLYLAVSFDQISQEGSLKLLLISLNL